MMDVSVIPLPAKTNAQSIWIDARIGRAIVCVCVSDGETMISRQLKREADQLQAAVHESERAARHEGEKVSRHLNQDVSDLVSILEDQDRVCADLQSSLKHQHRHIQELQSSFAHMSQNYDHAIHTMSSLQTKADKLCHEIDAVRRSTSAS